MTENVVERECSRCAGHGTVQYDTNGYEYKQPYPDCPWCNGEGIVEVPNPYGKPLDDIEDIVPTQFTIRLSHVGTDVSSTTYKPFKETNPLKLARDVVKCMADGFFKDKQSRAFFQKALGHVLDDEFKIADEPDDDYSFHDEVMEYWEKKNWFEDAQYVVTETK